MTSDTILLAGVIGQPIVQSKSPVLHGHWLQRYGIKGHYIPMDASSANLPHVLNNLPKMGFRGVNITLPHKESVLDLADVISDRAALIGAALLVGQLPVGDGSIVQMLAFHAPPLLLIGLFLFRELPRFEVPPIPRKLRYRCWLEPTELSDRTQPE